MPGMMDTILNLGLNDASVQGLKTKTGNGRFAKDSYRRFIQMFGNVVLGHRQGRASSTSCRRSRRRPRSRPTSTSTESDLDDVIARYKAVGPEADRPRLPAGPARAARGRSRRGVRVLDEPPRGHVPQAERHPPRPRHGGQRAVAWCSETWATRRPPASASRATPRRARRSSTASSCRTRRAKTSWPASARRNPITELEKVMPEAYKQLREITTRLERHYKDVQDFEFTIQENKLYMLQTRNGKRTGLAAVHIAVDLVDEGILTQQRSRCMKVEPQALDQLLHPIFEPKERAQGRGGGEGAAGLARRGDRRRGLHGRRRRGLEPEGQARAPRPHGDGARRHPRHERGAGHPHRDRRHDLARGRRGPADGQALGRGLRRPRRSTPKSADAEGRRPVAGARARASRSTAPPARSS